MRLLTIAALLIVAIVSAYIALVEWSQRITGEPEDGGFGSCSTVPPW